MQDFGACNLTDISIRMHGIDYYSSLMLSEMTTDELLDLYSDCTRLYLQTDDVVYKIRKEKLQSSLSSRVRIG